MSIAPGKTATGALLFTALALFMLGSSRLISVVGARKIARPLVAFGAVLSLVGIAQRGLTATDPRPLIYGFWQPVHETTPFGPFVNPNHFAGWMLMALPIALAAFVDLLQETIASGALRRGRRLSFLSSPQSAGLTLLAGAGLVMGLSLLMTRSRSGLGAFAVGAVIVGALVFRGVAPGKARAAMAVSVVALVLGAVSWAGLDTLVSKFTETQGRKSAVSRVAAWQDTLSIARRFPFTGSGIDTYGTAMTIYQANNRELHFEEAHNDYLQLAAEGGLLVGLPVLLTIGLFIRDVRRRFAEAPREGTTYCLRVGATAGLIAMALQSIVEFSLQMPGNAALFALLAALALHRSPNLRTARSTPDPSRT